MKNSEYWQKRAQQLEDAQTKKNTEYFGGELERIYQKAIRDTEKDIASWYTRFAKNNSITMAEAKKLLNSRELEEFKWTVEEYIDYGQENAVSGEWMKQLENASARYHISRLEALKLQMQNHVEVLMGKEVDGVTGLLREHLEDGYYRTAFEMQKFIGGGTSFARLDEDAIEKLLSKPWTSDGTNFSKRIWGTHRTELVNDLHKQLTQAITKGENPKVIAKGFAKYVSDEAAKSFRAKKSRAENLVMTETSFFRSTGQKRCYEELGVEEFENCATLDAKTSETCRDMDGTHFPVADMRPGVNSPPFHNRCRTATCPYFDDEFTADEVRAARAADGSYYTVPADMTYREWKKSFVSDENGLQSDDNHDIIKESKRVLKKSQMAKLQNAMPDDDFEQYFELLSNNTTSNISSLYAQFADKCNNYTLTPNIGAYSPSNDVVQFHFESERNIKDGMNRYNILAHECGHMFDKHIGRNLSAHFTELDAVNAIGSKKFGAVKMLKETPSNSDEFLSALREDAENMRLQMGSESWDAIRDDMLSSSASSGVQDFLDGFFGTQSRRGKYYLPWGHGERYYNRKYNSWIKSFGLEKDLKQLYLKLGFDASNQSKVKTLYRIYETASEAWANCASAETVGGKELEFIKKYMSKTYEAFIKLIGGVNG